MSGWVKRYIGKHSRAIVFVLAVFLSLPIEWGILQGAYLWLSPHLFINRLLAGHGLIVFHLSSALVLWFCLKNRRWFCNRLCPVGWCCSLASRLSFRKKYPIRKIGLGRILVLVTMGFSLAGIPLLLFMDPLVAFRSFFSGWILPVSVCGVLWGSLFLLIVLSNLFFPYYWCRNICPLGGLQELAADGYKKPSVLLSRRNTILLLGSWGTGCLLSHKVKEKPVAGFRPPSARKGNDFYITCLRCGNCVEACPASIIRLNKSVDSVLRWQTPELDYSKGYCWSDCNKCGEVCPTGALVSFSLAEKKKLIIGHAEVNTADCLLARNRECDRCYSVCDYDAIYFTRQNLLAQVQIETDKCVGCNACALICPEKAIHMVPHITVRCNPE